MPIAEGVERGWVFKGRRKQGGGARADMDLFMAWRL